MLTKTCDKYYSKPPGGSVTGNDNVSKYARVPGVYRNTTIAKLSQSCKNTKDPRSHQIIEAGKQT